MWCLLSTLFPRSFNYRTTVWHFCSVSKMFGSAGDHQVTMDFCAGNLDRKSRRVAVDKGLTAKDCGNRGINPIVCTLCRQILSLESLPSPYRKTVLLGAQREHS